MNYLEIVIEELEREKQTLLLKKNKNLEKIKDCEEKIKYYTYLYNHFKQYSMHYVILMNGSLNKAAQFSKRKKSLFEMPDLFGPSFESLMEERYDYLKKQKTKCDKKKLNAEKCLDYYTRKYNFLTEENLDIDTRLIEIEETIIEKRSKQGGKVLKKMYLLERGKENDWY